MAKWSKVVKGDRIELRGKTFDVVKIKAKGKSAKVTVRGNGSVFESKVALADKVKIVTAPLRDKAGTQTRWAKPSEVTVKAPKEPKGLGKGNPKATKPPADPSGDPWETKRDKVERKLDDLLSARLVGETKNEAEGYYVPPADEQTVAAHLALFHGIDPSEYAASTWLALHDAEHAGALKGQALTVNHWHTETRP